MLPWILNFIFICKVLVSVYKQNLCGGLENTTGTEQDTWLPFTNPCIYDTPSGATALDIKMFCPFL